MILNSTHHKLTDSVKNHVLEGTVIRIADDEDQAADREHNPGFGQHSSNREVLAMITPGSHNLLDAMPHVEQSTDNETCEDDGGSDFDCPINSE